MSPLAGSNRNLKFPLIFFIALSAFWSLCTVPWRKDKGRNVQGIAASQWNTSLVIVPAIWNEIDWKNPSGWPSWLAHGLPTNYRSARPMHYTTYLTQRVDPASRPPYQYPFVPNIHQEAGVYVKFILDNYDDLPNLTLFVHGHPYEHTPHLLDKLECLKKGVDYASLNTFTITGRTFREWAIDLTDNTALMYKCAHKILSTMGLDSDKLLFPDHSIPRDQQPMRLPCCAQFVVSRRRLRSYTKAQWQALWQILTADTCSTDAERDHPANYVGGSLEHTWHIILGLRKLDQGSTSFCSSYEPNSQCPGSPCLR